MRKTVIIHELVSMDTSTILPFQVIDTKNFRWSCFDPYQHRRDQWVGETVTRIYQKGISTREVGRMIERMLVSAYSATKVSNITDVPLGNIKSIVAATYKILFYIGMIFESIFGELENKDILYFPDTF